MGWVFDILVVLAGMLLLALLVALQVYFMARQAGVVAVRGVRGMDWTPVLSSNVPANMWLATKREGEDGENVCMALFENVGDQIEWVERGSGRTTVTHHSFAPPTHWRYMGGRD